MFEWAYAGVDHTLAGNGGQECVDFIPLWQKFAESALACIFAAVCVKYAYSRITLPEKIPDVVRNPDSCAKRLLLVSMCLVFGIELGFKFATRQFIWVFNPCHVTSMIQIYLLAAPPGKAVTAMFRLHLHMLSGAPIAILFPVINTRLLPFETEVYFIQHILMMIIPYFLMKTGGVYTAEKLTDCSWALMSLAWLYFFHFVPISYLAVLSQVNLNNMLCPAVSDPFYGRLYRICAMIHQVILIPLIGKFIVVTSYMLGLAKRADDREIPVFDREQINLVNLTSKLVSNFCSDNSAVEDMSYSNGVTDLKLERNGVVHRSGGEDYRSRQENNICSQ